MIRKFNQREFGLASLLGVLFLLFTVLISAGEAILSASLIGVPGGSLNEGLGAAQTNLAGTGVDTSSDITPAITDILTIIISLVALEAFIGFVVAGIFFVAGFGSDSSIQRAKKILVWNTVGIFVVGMSASIITFVLDLL